VIDVTDKVLDEMVHAIAREIDPEQIYLFGSHARGTARPDSDVDLLIVEAESPCRPGSRWEKLVRLSELLARFRVPNDVLIYSRPEVEKWRYSINHVVARALREGKLLYERH
jgi:predicted nucleotidyltransferase